MHKKKHENMNFEVLDISGGSVTHNMHFTRMSNQGDLLRSMVLDINSISDDELPDIFPTTQGIS